MRRLLLCLSAVLAASGGVVLAQEDSGQSPHERLKPLEYFIGDWDLDVEMNFAGQEPIKTTFHRTFAWALDGKYIRTVITEPTDDRVEPRAESLIAWSEEDGRINESVFWSNSMPVGPPAWTEVVALTPEGDQWHVRREGVHGVYTILDENTHRYDCQFGGADGKENNWHFLARRVARPSEAEALKWLAYTAGDWTIKWSDGDTAQISWSLQAGGKALAGRFTSSNGNEGGEMVGWRPDLGAIVVTGFGETGNYWSIKYTDFGEDFLKGTITGVFGDGRPMEGRFTFQKIDEDHFEFRFNGLAAGEAAELVGKSTRKR